MRTRERAVQAFRQGAEAMRKGAGDPLHTWAYYLHAFADMHNRLDAGDSDRTSWEPRTGDEKKEKGEPRQDDRRWPYISSETVPNLVDVQELTHCVM